MKNLTHLIFVSLFLIFGFNSAYAQQIMSVTGAVIDQTNRNPASIIVSFYDKNNKKIGSSKSNSATGFYLVTGLKQGETYKVQLESPDYFKDEYEVTLPVSKKYADVSRDFTVKPLAKGIKILLEVTPFELKKSKLRVGAEDYLADVKKMMILNLKTFSFTSFPKFFLTVCFFRRKAVKKFYLDQSLNKCAIAQVSS